MKVEELVSGLDSEIISERYKEKCEETVKALNAAIGYVQTEEKACRTKIKDKNRLK